MTQADRRIARRLVKVGRPGKRDACIRHERTHAYPKGTDAAFGFILLTCCLEQGHDRH